jgi:hypothetical protein
VDGVVAALARPALFFDSFGEEEQRVSTDELVRVVRLLLDVHPDHLEPRPVIPNGGTAGAAEQIQQPRPHIAPRMNAGISYGSAGGLTAK